MKSNPTNPKGLSNEIQELYKDEGNCLLAARVTFLILIVVVIALFTGWVS